MSAWKENHPRSAAAIRYANDDTVSDADRGLNQSDFRQATSSNAVASPGDALDFDIPFATALTTSGAVTYSAGTYTIVTPGAYHISAQLRPNNFATFTIQQTGSVTRSQFAWGAEYSNTISPATVTWEGVFVCAAGDTLFVSGNDIGFTSVQDIYSGLRVTRIA